MVENLFKMRLDTCDLYTTYVVYLFCKLIIEFKKKKLYKNIKQMYTRGKKKKSFLFLN